MKIYAPVEDTNGIYASVMFVNGVGETDNPVLIKWFERQGYKMVDESHISTEICNKTIEMSVEKYDEPDFDAMTPNDLRDWMREHGYGGKIKNTRNKEKLLAILRG